jgi:hypothetical protein
MPERPFKFLHQVRFEYFVTVLCGPDNVVLMLVGGMIEILNPHETSLPYMVL